MRPIVGGIRLLFVAIYIVLVLLVITLIFPFCASHCREALIQRLAKLFLFIVGLRLTIKGQLPQQCVSSSETGNSSGYMVVSNHISFMDIFVLDAVLPVRFVAKEEISRWPIFGFISRGVGTLFIDRTRRRAVFEIVELMGKTLAGGQNVLFFPEGTTGWGVNLLPFHANLFAAAILVKAPILPVTLRYTENDETTQKTSYAGDIPLFTVLKRIIMTKGLGVEVTILDPIDTHGRERHELCAQSSRLMAGALGVADATAIKAAEMLARRQARVRELEEKKANTADGAVAAS